MIGNLLGRYIDQSRESIGEGLEAYAIICVEMDLENLYQPILILVQEGIYGDNRLIMNLYLSDVDLIMNMNI